MLVHSHEGASSVFVRLRRSSDNHARRALLSFADYAAANRWAKADGKGLSRQLWNILPKIREVDALVTPERQRRLFEMSPELSLAVLAGAPMAHPKTTPAGRTERIDALAVKIYLPLVRPVDPGEQLDDSRLPGPVRAEKRDFLTRCDTEVQAPDDRDLVVAGRKVRCFDQRRDRLSGGAHASGPSVTWS